MSALFVRDAKQVYLIFTCALEMLCIPVLTARWYVSGGAQHQTLPCSFLFALQPEHAAGGARQAQGLLHKFVAIYLNVIKFLALINIIFLSNIVLNATLLCNKALSIQIVAYIKKKTTT